MCLPCPSNRVQDKLEEIEPLVQVKGEISATDPDSRLMKINNGGCGACHNIQIAVDSKKHIVVAVDVTSEAGDKEQLFHMSELTKEKLDIEGLTVLGDKGHYTASEFANCMKNDIVPIVSKAKNEKSASSKEYSKSKFTYLPEQDAYVCPQGNLLLNKIRRPSSKIRA